MLWLDRHSLSGRPCASGKTSAATVWRFGDLELLGSGVTTSLTVCVYICVCMYIYLYIICIILSWLVYIYIPRLLNNRCLKKWIRDGVGFFPPSCRAKNPLIPWSDWTSSWVLGEPFYVLPKDHPREVHIFPYIVVSLNFRSNLSWRVVLKIATLHFTTF